MLKKILKSYDYSIVVVMVLLIIFGLIMVYSASMVWAVQRYGFESDYFYQRQKVHIIFSLLVFVFIAFIPYKIFQSNKILIPMVVISLVRFSWTFRFWPRGRECSKLV